MSEPTISCPSCQTEIKLTESLAAPLLQATRKELEAKIAAKDADIAKREDAIKAQQKALEDQRKAIDEQVAEKIKTERTAIAAEEARKAKVAVSDDIEAKARELAELQQVLKEKNDKLAEAQKTQAELLKKERELDDAKRELDLTVEKRIQEGLDLRGRTICVLDAI